MGRFMVGTPAVYQLGYFCTCPSYFDSQVCLKNALNPEPFAQASRDGAPDTQIYMCELATV